MPFAAAAGRACSASVSHMSVMHTRPQVEAKLARHRAGGIEQVLDEANLQRGIAREDVQRAVPMLGRRRRLVQLPEPPWMTFSGVRNSCESTARNSSFSRFDSSAASRADRSRAIAAWRSVYSWTFSRASAAASATACSASSSSGVARCVSAQYAADRRDRVVLPHRHDRQALHERRPVGVVRNARCRRRCPGMIAASRCCITQPEMQCSIGKRRPFQSGAMASSS